MLKVKKRYSVPTAIFVLLALITSGIYYYFSNLPLVKKQLDTASSAAIPKVILASATAGGTATPSASPSAAPVPQIPYNSGHTVRVPIFYYHYIGNNPNPADKARDALSVTPDKFDAQLGYLSQNGFNTITLDTFYNALKGKGGLPPKPVILTFDDGYVDFYINAFPIISKYHLHVVSFIPTGLIDTAYYLHWDQIKAMKASGLVEFEAHSVNHLNLAALTGDRLKYQIYTSKQVLSSEIGAPVDYFAYPYGTSNEESWQVVQQAGYKAAFGTWGSSVESEGTQFDLPRIKVGSTWSVEDFAKRAN